MGYFIMLLFHDQLAHPILDSLKGTTNAWLIDLLLAFNTGDIASFENISAAWRTQSDLSASYALLRQKISLLALMEMVFRCPAKDRSLPFADIATHTQLPVDQVELLLMKALALGLVKGRWNGTSSVSNIKFSSRHH